MNIVADLLIGVMAYQLKKWLGDELVKYIFKPIFNKVFRPILRPIGAFLKARLLKTEHQAMLYAQSRHKAANKRRKVSDIDAVTI